MAAAATQQRGVVAGAAAAAVGLGRKVFAKNLASRTLKGDPPAICLVCHQLLYVLLTNPPAHRQQHA